MIAFWGRISSGIFTSSQDSGNTEKGTNGRKKERSRMKKWIIELRKMDEEMNEEIKNLMKEKVMDGWKERMSE